VVVSKRAVLKQGTQVDQDERGCLKLLGEAAKNITHHAQELERAGIAYTVIHTVCVLAGAQHTFVAQNCKML
jgi:hypothetical protein